jgi:hypothetical protein
LNHLGERGRLQHFGWIFSTPIPPLIFVRNETNMLRLFKKKDEAVRNWHSRAILIDLHKTRVTIIHKQTFTFENNFAASRKLY